MTEQDKQLISEYMGWTTEPYWWCEKCKEEKSPYHVTYNTNCSDCGCAVVVKEDHPFDPNDASLCVQEMQKRGELYIFLTWIDNNLPYKEWSNFIAWIFNPDNFFSAFVEWRKMK